ncbi:MAG TPA: MFS transporter [Actinophytocola sp.]|uniref:MFS transporter n=1 Tax=Actinophytocola sp. TaxID=1872138 RepID=UPI002DDD234A|nr:MFS transporter [Actinophytocola sp.]HEV2783747.1 MFS transporter [Actinophytocola sp.]
MKGDVALRLPRDLYIACGARAMTMLGSMVAVTALLLDMQGRGAGAWAVSGVLAAGTLPIVLLGPVIGILVDRYDSRALLIACGMWQAGTCAVLAFLTDPVLVLPLVTLNAIGTALAVPLLLSLTRLMVADEQLAAANSLQQGSHMLAMLTGPAVSGLLTGLTGGARVPLLLDAGLFLLITVAALLITTRRQSNGGPMPRAREGITALFTDSPLATVVVLAFLLVLVTHLTYVAQVFLVRETFGASALAFGLLQATFTVGLLTGTVLASRLNTARRIVLMNPIFAVVMSTAIILIGSVSVLPAVFALYVLAGVGASVVSVSVGTMLMLRTPESTMGRALASFHALNRAAALGAYGVGGFVVGMLAPGTVYILSGVSALIAVLVMIPALRRAWRATAPVTT